LLFFVVAFSLFFTTTLDTKVAVACTLRMSLAVSASWSTFTRIVACNYGGGGGGGAGLV